MIEESFQDPRPEKKLVMEGITARQVQQSLVTAAALGNDEPHHGTVTERPSCYSLPKVKKSNTKKNKSGGN